MRTHVRTVVLPHVNEWKRVPKVARGVVAERGKWERKKEEGARKRETGVVGKRERGGRTHESKQRGKEARARKRDLCRTNGRRSGKKREREKKRETNDAKHMGLVSNVANYYVVKVGLCPLSVKGRPKDVSLAISNLYLVLFRE